MIADILQSRGELDEALRIRREEELPVYERLGDVPSATSGSETRAEREEELPVYERLGDAPSATSGSETRAERAPRRARPAPSAPRAERLSYAF